MNKSKSSRTSAPSSAPQTKTQTNPAKPSKKGGRLKARLLDTYYGHPIKDMKLICITGTTGKTTVAHFVHEILNAAGQRVAVLASDDDIKVGTLHKFFSDAWKAGAEYVVVTAPAASLEKDAFYGLPIHVAALTDYIPAGLDTPSAKEFTAAESTLFQMQPEIVVLNRDDAYYHDFRDFAGTKATITYGSDYSSDIQIESSKLYKKGSEAHLNLSGERFTVASFLSDQPAIHYMAAAAAIAAALKLAPDHIIDGLANFDPAEQAPNQR